MTTTPAKYKKTPAVVAATNEGKNPTNMLIKEGNSTEPTAINLLNQRRERLEAEILVDYDNFEARKAHVKRPVWATQENSAHSLSNCAYRTAPLSIPISQYGGYWDGLEAKSKWTLATLDIDMRRHAVWGPTLISFCRVSGADGLMVEEGEESYSLTIPEALELAHTILAFVDVLVETEGAA